MSEFTEYRMEKEGYFERHPVVFGAILMAIFIISVLGSVVLFKGCGNPVI